jgi:hypothetical protein
MNTRERLIELMLEYKLERREIADLVKVRRETVDYWLLPHESKSHVEIPEMAIELLELKLGTKPEQKEKPSGSS